MSPGRGAVRTGLCRTGADDRDGGAESPSRYLANRAGFRASRA